MFFSTYIRSASQLWKLVNIHKKIDVIAVVSAVECVYPEKVDSVN